LQAKVEYLFNVSLFSIIKVKCFSLQKVQPVFAQPLKLISGIFEAYSVAKKDPADAFNVGRVFELLQKQG